MTTVNARDPAWAGGAVADGVTDSTTAIQTAMAAVNSSGGGQVILPEGTIIFTALSFAGMNNVRLVGQGEQATVLKSSQTTGNLFDFTGASFCGIELLSFVAGAQRTAGAVFYLDKGTGSCQRNQFRRLRIHGGFKCWQLNDCSTTVVEEIQVTDFNITHPWDSVIHLSGQTTTTRFKHITGGTSAAMTNGFVYITGALVDTILFDKIDISNFTPSTGITGVNITNGEWIYFTDLSIECGTTGDAFVVSGGRGISLTACHLLGKRGLVVSAGTSVRMIGGGVLKCAQQGIAISGGSHHEIIGVTFSDLSQSSTGTYDGINIAAGVSDFTICDNHFGNMLLGLAALMRFGICMEGGASDRYVVQGNRFVVAAMGTPIFDATVGGTGKIVRDNVYATSEFVGVASATTVTLPANATLVNITGTTTITSIVASYAGRRVTLVFAGILTLTDGSNLKLAGNFVTTADDTICLVSDGTNWIEEGRSVN